MWYCICINTLVKVTHGSEDTLISWIGFQEWSSDVNSNYFKEASNIILLNRNFLSPLRSIDGSTNNTLSVPIVGMSLEVNAQEPILDVLNQISLAYGDLCQFINFILLYTGNKLTLVINKR